MEKLIISLNQLKMIANKLVNEIEGQIARGSGFHRIYTVSKIWLVSFNINKKKLIIFVLFWMSAISYSPVVPARPWFTGTLLPFPEVKSVFPDHTS